MSKNISTKQDVKNLICANTAADLKGFASRDAFIYHVNNKPGTPQPLLIDGIRFWHRAEIEAWVPTKDTPGPKPRNKGVTNGKKNRSS